MNKNSNKDSILQFCRSQIRTLNGKHAGIEKIVDDYFLGKNIRHKRENPDLFNEINMTQRANYLKQKKN